MRTFIAATALLLYKLGKGLCKKRKLTQYVSYTHLCIRSELQDLESYT